MRRLTEGEVFAIIFIVIIICFTVGLTTQQVQQEATARSCINAGGTWVGGSAKPDSPPATCTLP